MGKPPTPPRRSPIDSVSIGFAGDSTTSRKAVERAIRMVWVGPLLGSEGTLEEIPSKVDRDLLPKLLKEWKTRLSFRAPDMLHGRGTLDIALEFSDLRDFRPERVLECVPTLKSFAAVRSIIERLRNEPIDLSTLVDQVMEAGAEEAWAHDFKAMVSSSGVERSGDHSPLAVRTSNPKQSGHGDPLSDILDLVDLPQGHVTGSTDGGHLAPRAQTEDPLQNLVRRLGGATGRSRGLEKEVAAHMVRDLDKMLGAQLAAILHHPDFVRLETAWRGLKFLVDRTDFKKGVVLEVLAASKEDLPDVLERFLVSRERDGGVSVPLVALWIDFEFDSTVRDIEMLGKLGEIGEGLSIPVVAAVGPSFFGVNSMEQIEQQSPLWDFFKRPEFIPFAALRGKSCAGSIALALPRVLSRVPYGKGSPTRGMVWDETAYKTWPRACWNRPLGVIASAVTSSQARQGWPTGIIGPTEGRVENLPIAPIAGDDSRSAMVPVDAALTEPTIEELSDAGFTVLSAPRNADYACVASAPMLSRAASSGQLGTSRSSTVETTLPYQMLVALVAGIVRGLAADLHAIARDEIAEHFRAGLAAGLGISDHDRLEVLVTPAESGLGRHSVEIQMKLPFRISGEEPAMNLTLDVGP
jgi:type VI secretion system ImpC/EvpB family protein/type VI secretion system ImpB/VipA family protein